MKTPKKQKADDPAKAKELSEQDGRDRRIGQQVPRHHQGRGDRERAHEELLAFPSTARCPADWFPALPSRSRPSWKKTKAAFTHAEVAGMIQALLEERTRQRGQQQVAFCWLSSIFWNGGLRRRPVWRTKAAAKSKEAQGQDSCWHGLPIQDHLAGHRSSDLAANPDQGLHLGQVA